MTGVSEDPAIAETLPHTFELFQSYPNPFSAGNPSAAIRFHVPVGWTQPISLRVFNMQGQLVTTLVEGIVSPGIHTAKWDGKDGFGNTVASGVYLYQLTAGQLVVVRRMVFAK
ncbi:MAG: FlgD immunoglobulin-like domain containing protein [bacterium]